MTLTLGSGVVTPYLGAQPVTRVMLGSVQVWPPEPTEPSIFSDDFNRADQVLGDSPNWQRMGGAPGVAVINAGMLQFSGAGQPDTLYYAPDAASMNHFAQIQNKVPSGVSLNGFPLVVAALDQNNYIGIRPRTTNWQALRCVGGAFTVLAASAAGTLVADDVIRAEVSGGQVRFFRNGVQFLGPWPVTAALASASRTGLVVRADSRNPVLDNWQSGAL